MALTKYKLGELIELVQDTNSELQYGSNDVRGMSITKEIIPTKADVTETDLSNFFVVSPGDFIYNPRTHGKKIGFGYNNTCNTFIISWNNIAFRVQSSMNNVVLSDYLFLHFKREEWDREACFQSWGSSTEVFAWETLCNMEIDLPPLAIQQKYVDVYNAMLENQKSYERGLDDLKLVCDAYIEDLRRKIPCEKIGKYIKEKNDRNIDKSIAIVMGLSTKKEFREAQSRVNREELGKYKIVTPDDIAFVPTTDTWKVLAFALNTYKKKLVVSPIYTVFCVNKDILLPEYLAVWLSRTEFDRYARFHSWGSARENFSFEEMKEVSIPIPDLDVQRAIVDIHEVYKHRKAINEKLKEWIKDICPILIKGSVEESKKG